jgi:hypothetical protein
MTRASIDLRNDDGLPVKPGNDELKRKGDSNG